MNKSRASTGPLAPAILSFIAAFFVIKILSAEMTDQLLRHCAIAMALFIFPLIHRRSSLVFFRHLAIRAKNSWGGYFCLVYALFPALVLMFLFPGEWMRARLELSRWVLSSAGLSAILIAPLAEEFFFRGWLFSLQDEFQKKRETGTKTNKINGIWICYWNALLFWIFHFPVQPGALDLWKEALSRGLVPLSPGPFLLGLTTSGLTLLTGTPRAAFIFHCLANALGPLWWPLLREQNIRTFFYF